MHRFWSDASVEAGEDGFAVRLDARPVRTPAGAVLAVPSRDLAEAIAAEWRGAGEGEAEAGGGKDRRVRPDALPLTRIAATALDRVAPDPAATVAALSRYAETDLLCYRADQPPELAARQHALWQPHLDWAAQALDAPLSVTRGIMPLSQDASALAALSRALARLDAFQLAAAALAVGALGSLVLGLALVHGRLDAAAATEASLVDEHFQAGLWGEDAEAAARRARIAEEVALAARFLDLCRAPA
jgi:chaperone required for assembly of F1-ATPase